VELDDYFPAQFPKGRENTYYSKLKEQLLLKLKNLQDPDDETQRKIEAVDDWFRSLINPQDFGKIEPLVELDFERLCHQLSEHTNRDVKRMTVKEFYSLMDVVEKKNKTNSRH
jgi:CRISPR/Cas system CSM-associated protein Csm2 small subunit